MNYIQYMKPGGATENKKETSKFIEWLNKAGKSWKDFWDKPVIIQYAYNPHAVVGNGGAPFSSTQRRGDFATQAAGALAVPATATGVATVGVVPTLVGMGTGMGAGIAADIGGAKLAELAGGDENALEMVGDIAGFTLGALAGGKATKATTNYLNFWNSWLNPKSVYTTMAEALTPVKTSSAGIWTNRGTRAAKISEAELLGIPKGDRGNLSRFQKEALEDLATYRNKWIHQRYPLLDNNGNIIWSNGTNKSFLDTYVAPLRGDQYKGVLLYPHIEDDGSYLMRMSMGSDDLNGGFAGYNGISEITLTSPKMNAINLEIPIPVEQASPTLPKDGVKTFWAALQDIALPGSYISGDFGGRPLGYNLIRQYNKIGTPIVSTTNTGVRTIIGRNGYLNVLNELFRKIPWKSHYDGLSTDSYMALLKLGNRPGYKLRFSKDGFTNWNHLSFENKYILDLYEQALTDPTKLQEFLKVFHDWVAPYGGLDAVIKNGKIIIPLPFIVRQKSGGTIKIKKKNIGSFTRYCNGKVTEECIRKGKNSSNPTTRKRANFAANARKWKHEEGGKINYLNMF